MYAFRGLPCTIAPDERLWCVSGRHADGSGGGILEWCHDQEDAEAIRDRMQASGDFVNLSAHPYRDPCDVDAYLHSCAATQQYPTVADMIARAVRARRGLTPRQERDLAIQVGEAWERYRMATDGEPIPAGPWDRCISQLRAASDSDAGPAHAHIALRAAIIICQTWGAGKITAEACAKDLQGCAAIAIRHEGETCASIAIQTVGRSLHAPADRAPSSTSSTPIRRGRAPQSPRPDTHMQDTQAACTGAGLTVIEVERGVVWVGTAAFPGPPEAGTRVIWRLNGDAIPATVVGWFDEYGHRHATLQLDRPAPWWKPGQFPDRVAHAVAREIHPEVAPVPTGPH